MNESFQKLEAPSIVYQRFLAGMSGSNTRICRSAYGFNGARKLVGSQGV
jgi:hypothetical protein